MGYARPGLSSGVFYRHGDQSVVPVLQVDAYGFRGLQVLVQVAQTEAVLPVGVDVDVVGLVSVLHLERLDPTDPLGLDVDDHSRHLLRGLVGVVPTSAGYESKSDEEEGRRADPHARRVNGVSTYSPSLEELVERVDAELIRWLARRRAELPEATEMLDEITRLLGAGGKRLRPAFCYWGHRAAGGRDSAEIARAASSLELLHTFALVHDDIMDRSDERRGLPTTNALHGTNVALLVGDLALVLADACFLDAGFGAEDSLAAFSAYSRMRQQVIAGQYLDVRASERPTIDEPSARRIAVLKSGRYTIQEPLVIGAELAGGPKSLVDGLRAFGAPLGEAFQLRDDLLGSFGDRSSVGKPVDSDIREGKRHVLYAKGVALLSGDERDFLVSRWGGGEDLGAEEIGRLRRLLESSGARSATEDLLANLRDQALKVLVDLPIAEEPRQALADLADRSTERDL